MHRTDQNGSESLKDLVYGMFEKQWITEAHKNLGMVYQEMSCEEYDEMLRRLCRNDRLDRAETDMPYYDRSSLWRRVKYECKGVHPDARWFIEDYPLDGELVLFLDSDQGRKGWVVSSWVNMVRLLGDCPGFDFFITNRLCDFLIGFDDEADVLICSGVDRDWFDSKIPLFEHVYWAETDEV